MNTKLRSYVVGLLFVVSSTFAENNISFQAETPIEIIADKGVEIFASPEHPSPYFSFNGSSTNTVSDYGPGSFNITTSNNNQNIWFNGKNFDYLLNGRRVALFIIPLNYTTNGIYNAFELKATTNNYDHGVEEYERLLFYSQSEIADEGISLEDAELPNLSIDRMWMFVCTAHNAHTDGFNGDERSYFFITNTAAKTAGWDHQMTTLAVLVDTECLERHREIDSNGKDIWLKNGNDELIWQWHRLRYVPGEMEPIGEYEDETSMGLWRPISPIRWYHEMPKWATDQLREFWPRENLQDKLNNNQ